MTEDPPKPKTWAAIRANRLNRLRRLAAELRENGWTVIEPPEGQEVKDDRPTEP